MQQVAFSFLIHYEQSETGILMLCACIISQSNFLPDSLQLKNKITSMEPLKEVRLRRV